MLQSGLLQLKTETPHYVCVCVCVCVCVRQHTCSVCSAILAGITQRTSLVFIVGLEKKEEEKKKTSQVMKNS